jgi:hypothetical protein
MDLKKLETSEEKKARLAKNRDVYRKNGKRKLQRIELRDLKNSRRQEKNENL